MPVKGSSTHLRAPELEPHYHMQLSELSLGYLFFYGVQQFSIVTFSVILLSENNFLHSNSHFKCHGWNFISLKYSSSSAFLNTLKTFFSWQVSISLSSFYKFLLFWLPQILESYMFILKNQSNICF